LPWVGGRWRLGRDYALGVNEPGPNCKKRMAGPAGRFREIDDLMSLIASGFRERNRNFSHKSGSVPSSDFGGQVLTVLVNITPCRIEGAIDTASIKKLFGDCMWASEFDIGLCATRGLVKPLYGCTAFRGSSCGWASFFRVPIKSCEASWRILVLLLRVSSA